MLVLDHASISVPSTENARPFYDAVMAALGVAKIYGHPDALDYGVRCNDYQNFIIGTQDAALTPCQPCGAQPSRGS